MAKWNKPRSPERIDEDWAKIMIQFYLLGVQSVRCSTLNRTMRYPRFLSSDLRAMQKAGLLSFDTSKRLWTLVDPNYQPIVVKNAGHGKTIKVTELPQWSTFLQKVKNARPPKDLRQAYWVRQAKAEFAGRIEVIGGRINWSEADEQLCSVRRIDPVTTKIKLSNGCGATVTWACRCRLTIPWAGDALGCEPIWVLCEEGDACDRAVAQERHKDQIHHRGIVAGVPVTQEPISFWKCYTIDFNPPAGLQFGSIYSHQCGCHYVVSNVMNMNGTTGPTRAGVISQYRGKLCQEHLAGVVVSQESLV